MEIVDVYNNRGEYLKKTCERGTMEKGEYSRSVHVWILDNERILMQRRSSEKKIFPNMWEQSGGGVVHGENSLQAVKRETKEELGIDIANEEIKYIGSYIRVKDIVDVWLIEKDISNEKLELQTEEVADIKLLSFAEIDDMIIKNEVVPTIDPSYYMIKNYCNLYKKGKLI